MNLLSSGDRSIRMDIRIGCRRRYDIDLESAPLRRDERPAPSSVRRHAAGGVPTDRLNSRLK
jgi:hypothetical protein